MSPGLSLAVALVLRVGFDFLFPAQAMGQSWLRVLLDFAWPSVFPGPAECFAYGADVVRVFGPPDTAAADSSWSDRLR